MSGPQNAVARARRARKAPATHRHGPLLAGAWSRWFGLVVQPAFAQGCGFLGGSDTTLRPL